MNPKIKNALAIVAGLAIGSAVNMSIVSISGSIIPPPEGADVTTMEGLKKTMHLFQPVHFLFPFLAHALGTFTGALFAALIAATHKLRSALIIGLVFLAGGIYMVVAVPSPLWFTLVDLTMAYIPMSYAGAQLMIGRKPIME